MKPSVLISQLKKQRRTWGQQFAEDPTAKQCQSKARSEVSEPQISSPSSVFPTSLPTDLHTLISQAELGGQQRVECLLLLPSGGGGHVHQTRNRRKHHKVSQM